LGIYPTVETLLAQSIFLVALVLALLWLRRGTEAAASYRKA
jgi:high-affinity Fe2+/Pb2+ permease